MRLISSSNSFSSNSFILISSIVQPSLTKPRDSSSSWLEADKLTIHFSWSRRITRWQPKLHLAMRDTRGKVTLQFDSLGIDMIEIVDLREHSNEVFCALLLYENGWKA